MARVRYPAWEEMPKVTAMTAAATIWRIGLVENPREGEMYPGTPSLSPIHIAVMTPRMMPPV